MRRGLVTLYIAVLAAMGALLTTRVNALASRPETFVPVSLRASSQANYGVDHAWQAIRPVRLEIIAGAISDQEYRGADDPARLKHLLEALRDPVSDTPPPARKTVRDRGGSVPGSGRDQSTEPVPGGHSVNTPKPSNTPRPTNENKGKPEPSSTPTPGGAPTATEEPAKAHTPKPTHTPRPKVNQGGGKASPTFTPTPSAPTATAAPASTPEPSPGNKGGQGKGKGNKNDSN